MQEPKKPFFVLLNESTLSSKGENGYITGTDIVSDVAYCLNLWTWEDAEENNVEYFADTIEQVINGFDWKGYTRDLINANKAMNAQAHIKASEYLAGDYMQINEPQEFAQMVRIERERAETELRECLPYNSDADAPIGLLQALGKAQTYAWQSLHEEWLNGDRSTYGAIGNISKEFTGSHHSATYEEKADALIIEFTEEEARDFMSYSQDEAEPVNAEALQGMAISWLLGKAKAHAEMQEKRNSARRDDNKRKMDMEAQKLEGLKEEARKRKQAIT